MAAANVRATRHGQPRLYQGILPPKPEPAAQPSRAPGRIPWPRRNSAADMPRRPSGTNRVITSAVPAPQATTMPASSAASTVPGGASPAACRVPSATATSSSTIRSGGSSMPPMR